MNMRPVSPIESAETSRLIFRAGFLARKPSFSSRVVYDPISTSEGQALLSVSETTTTTNPVNKYHLNGIFRQVFIFIFYQQPFNCREARLRRQILEAIHASLLAQCKAPTTTCLSLKPNFRCNNNPSFLTFNHF